MDREAAWQLLCQWTQSENLRKHALAVEAAMRAYARKFGEDENLWGITGLLHDLDYERYPTAEEHPFRGVEHLRELGYPETMLQAILGHADYSGVPRETLLAKALYAVDELTGLVIAVALVRPTKKLADVDVKAVKKKFKEKSFAKGCNREDILRGAQELGVDFDEHVATVIEALQSIAGELGL
ncbi:MAG: HAD family hydrolase [Firmicutes bacterium]|nr:HAD family hydrolase [Bacillota bacterium]MBO2521521.1 HAD family hydrolase [Bacillota bacterium]